MCAGSQERAEQTGTGVILEAQTHTEAVISG